MRYLEKIYKNKLSIPAERSISPNMEMFVSNLVRQHTVEDSLAAYKTLESLCTVIDGYIEEKMERGAPQRETTDLAFEIAEAYRTAFGVMPTTNNCGYFAKIFDTVMDIVSPKDEPGDYSRAIKAAIQSLKPL
jgi:hypothetical protein